MRFVLITLVLIALVAAAVWADNAVRIKELQAQQQQIILEMNDRQTVIAQQQQAVQNLQSEFLRIDGAIRELQKQDADAKKPPVKEEPNK